MRDPVIRFSSVEELAPIFDHRGQLIFVWMVHAGAAAVDNDGSWRVYLRGPYGLSLKSPMTTLIHEFLHILYRFTYGYITPKDEAFLHEKDIDRAERFIFKQNPSLADDLLREIILNPRCSIECKENFPLSELRQTTFYAHLRGYVAEYTEQIRRGRFAHGDERREKVLGLAPMFEL